MPSRAASDPLNGTPPTPPSSLLTECCECGATVPGLSGGGRCAPCELGPHLELLAELAFTPAPSKPEAT